MDEPKNRADLPDNDLLAGEPMDGAVCDAASDLTARLLADLNRAEAELAIAEARAIAALSTGDEIDQDVRNQRILHRHQTEVLRHVLDGMWSVDERGASHVA